MVMQKTLPVFLLFLEAGAAFAQETILGNWRGAVTTGPLAGQPVEAKIIPQGGGQYLALMAFSGQGGETWSASIQGKRTDDVVAFEGIVDFGKERSGKAELSAEATGTRLVGVFSGGKHSGDFQLDRVFLKSPTLEAPPPAGAIVLIDGTNLDAWNVLPRWHITGAETMTIRGSSIVTKDQWGSAKIHVEFKIPLMAGERGQERGNSGVYVQGRYEVQVLDSFGSEGLDNECGGIYKIAKPLVNACLPPTEWQTYDIDFTAPKFDESGQKTANARITVVHNGMTIHNDLELPGVTAGGVSGEEAATGPLMLQDHRDEVEYRNVWIVPAAE